LRSEAAVRWLVLAGAVPGLLACELGETFVPPGQSFLLVHAVLHPVAFPVTGLPFLLERTWDGVRYVWQTGPPYSFGEPIVTGGGSPEIRATVEVTTPSGEVLRAAEPNATNPESCCAGMYFVPIAGSALVAGGTYELRIQTSSGEVLTARATMPAMPTVMVQPAGVFDRSRDTLRIPWAPVAHAAAYELVISNPYRDVTAFTESSTVHLTGALRNTGAEGFPNAFLPGFEQRVSVYAVDSNYYDYYRSSNGGTGRGLVNRITGGLGVFGAKAPVLHRVVQVVAPFTRPVEGTYRYFGTVEDSIRTLITGLTLYIESPAAKTGVTEALSGAYRARPRALAPLFFDTAGAFLGRKWGDSLELAFLSQHRITDTMEVFKARVIGDTIVGRYRQRLGTWRFLKN